MYVFPLLRGRLTGQTVQFRLFKFLKLPRRNFPCFWLRLEFRRKRPLSVRAYFMLMIRPFRAFLPMLV